MKCGRCEYDTDTEIPEGSTVAENQQIMHFHREDDHQLAKVSKVIPKVREMEEEEESCKDGQFLCMDQDLEPDIQYCDPCYDH